MSNINMKWFGNQSGHADIKNAYVTTQVAIPIDIGGSGEGFSPKDLLVAASASCIMGTFLSILEPRNIVIIEKEISSKLESVNDVWTVTHTLSIGLDKTTSDDTLKTIHLAINSIDRHCEVGKILEQGGMIINLETDIYTIKVK